MDAWDIYSDAEDFSSEDGTYLEPEPPDNAYAPWPLDPAFNWTGEAPF